MDNWFLICKHVYFNLTCPPIRTVSGHYQPFQYPLWLKAQGVEVFSQVHEQELVFLSRPETQSAQLIAVLFLLMVLGWF